MWANRFCASDAVADDLRDGVSFSSAIDAASKSVDRISVIDLHEGVAAIFDEAGERATLDDLRFDNFTARNFTFEASWIAEARLAPGIHRWACPTCGDEVEQRPGATQPIHMGRRGEALCFWAPPKK